MKTLANSIVSLIAANLIGAAQASPECPLAIAEEVVARRVIDGASFEAEDGRRVRLAALLAPVFGSALAAEAKDALSKLILKKSVELAFDERSVDRHGDVVAHVFLGPERDWLQSDLISAGLARVQTQRDIRACAKPLLARESEARAASKGLWKDTLYRLRKADELAASIGTFQIVEGVPMTVAVRRDRIYLNFGADYRTDFTVTIARRDLKRFTAAGMDPSTWQGKRTRVRGWLSLLNGPEIELTHPEQVEVE